MPWRMKAVTMSNISLSSRTQVQAQEAWLTSLSPSSIPRRGSRQSMSIYSLCLGPRLTSTAGDTVWPSLSFLRLMGSSLKEVIPHSVEVTQVIIHWGYPAGYHIERNPITGAARLIPPESKTDIQPIYQIVHIFCRLKLFYSSQC